MILWLYVAGKPRLPRRRASSTAATSSRRSTSRGCAPLAAVVPGLVDLAIAFASSSCMLVVYGVTPSWRSCSRRLWVAAAALVALAVGVPFAAQRHVPRREARPPLLLQVWLFASPVVYPSSLVEGAWRYVYALNPMVGVLDGFRWSVADGRRRGRSARLRSALVARAPVGGLALLPARRAPFADVI